MISSTPGWMSWTRKINCSHRRSGVWIDGKANFGKMNAEIHASSCPTFPHSPEDGGLGWCLRVAVSMGCLSLQCLQTCWTLLEACHYHLMIFPATGKTVRQGTLLRYDGLWPACVGVRSGRTQNDWLQLLRIDHRTQIQLGYSATAPLITIQICLLPANHLSFAVNLEL